MKFGRKTTALIQAVGIAILLFMGTAPVSSQEQTPAVSAPALPAQVTVATRVLPPFVIKDADGYTGFSIQLWAEIAKQTGISYKWIETKNIKEILGAVDSHQADLAIAAISVTAEREAKFEFSQPMFESGLQILVPNQGENRSGFERFREFLTSDAMLFVLGFLGLLVLIPGHIAWYLERGHKRSVFSKDYFPGIFQSMFWAMSAFVGQQTKEPRSIPGRFMAALAILTSVIFITYVQATLTTAMTVAQLRGAIQGPNDLPGKKVGTTTGSTTTDWLRTHKVAPTEFQKIDDAFAALERGDLDAVGFDAPVLLYYASNGGKGKVAVVGEIFKKENYAILFPQGSPLRKPVNEALLKMRESGAYDRLYEEWFHAGR